uniref:Dystroglycan-type cadherin-like domain-containing protein n=1 Tax=Candidatus Kentrum sp. UNK TaxID=2126344 RepID=A0A451AU93_9GAMM|nr:MAG: hypothetical protein BECKUNK1418G_GA0071005_10155 [Candidatus Kentron sp. UNK]VFK69603.1 MAG: hypothetical protein BECKUNK1418H_GA0071006_101633 [Candidatus Kentron sp. UNK]
MRKEVNMGLGEMPTGGYFGLLALESRIMFDGSGTDLGEVVYNPNDSSQEDGISVVKESFTGTIFPGNKSLGHSQDNYIRFALANKQEYDTFYLKSSEKNSNNSYSENAILVGDDKTKDYDKDKDKILDLNLWMDLDEKGTKGWRKIGWVTGQNTTDLKIYLFREEFANHDFDKPIEGPNAEGGWTIVGGGLAPGMIGPTIDGKETVMPHPNTRLLSDHPDYLASADDLQAVVDLHRKLKIEMPRFVRDSEGKMGNWDFERRDYVFQGNSSANKALYMESKSIGVEHGGGRVYGPHAYSDELQLFKGEVFTFEYEEGPIGDPGDTGELFSYLLNMDNGKTIILDCLTKDDSTTDAMTRGAENRKHPDGTLSGWKEWRVPITETGRYRLVCAVYAFDESGGGRTGYNVAFDDIGVEMSTTVLDAIVRQVRYEKNTDEFIVPSMDMDQYPRKITISAKFKDGVEREVASGTLDFVEPPTIRPFGDVSNQVIDKGDGSLLFENPDPHHDFSVGKLQITGQGSDSYLFIRNQGNEAKQIGFDKDTKKITYGGKTIGTVDGVDDKGRGKHLHISFQADATPESVEALLRNVACTAPSNVSANGIIARGLTERDGASYDDITQDNKLTYEISKPRDTPFKDVSNQVIDKGDGSLLFENPNYHDFSKGYLRINYASSEQRGPGSDLSIGNQGNGSGQIGLDGTKITYEGKTIGTVDATENGKDGKPLRIVLQGATSRAVEALLRSATYVAPVKVPGVEVIAKVVEADGASYDDITQDSKLTYEISKPPDTPFKDVSNQVIDKGDGLLLFENPDHHDFSKGDLRINYAPSERRGPGSDLSIGNQGNGPGQIGLSGSTITYEGKTIGTVDATENGKDGKPLRIKFQEGATPRGIEALLRSVTYTAPYKVPAVNVTAQFTESDGTTHDDITLDNKRDYEIKKKKSGRGPEPPTPDPIGDQPVTPDDGPTTSQPPSSIWSSYRTSVGRDSSHRSGIYGFRIFGGSGSGESGRFDASVPESRAPLQCYDTNGHTISVGRGIEDQFIDRERFEFRIPIGAFIHTNSKAELEFQATMEDGSALPDWIGFESTVGIFTGVVPDDWDKEVFTLRIIARDIYSGCEAGTTFDLRVAREEGSANTPDNPDIGDKYHGKRNALVSAGGGDRLGLSAQMAAHGRSGFEMRQTAFIAMMSGSG